MKEISEALLLFAEHYPKLRIGAEHGLILVGPCEEDDIKKEHQEKLKELDFFYSPEYEGYVVFV